MLKNIFKLQNVCLTQNLPEIELNTIILLI